MFPTSALVHRVWLRPRLLITWIALLLTLAVCNVPAGAVPAGTDLPSIAPASAAMRIERDPITGTLTPAGPTAERVLLPLWSLNMRPALDRLSAVQLADGSLMVDLSGIYLDFAIARMDWTGHPQVDCDAPFTPDVLRPLGAPAAPTLTWAEE